MVQVHPGCVNVELHREGADRLEVFALWCKLWAVIGLIFQHVREAMQPSSRFGSAPRNRAIDLRSDTVTQPDADMRRAMAEAEVGDDVFGDDPTVGMIEERFAHLLGKEVSVLFPTGTQSNLSAILAHCGRGDEMLVGNRYHSYHDEAGGASALGGVAYCPLEVAADGSIEPQQIDQAVKADDPHYTKTRLLCLENTVAGTAVPLSRMREAAAAARRNGLAVHLDGARLFNAATALDENPASFAEVADTVSVCLSKGLGTPAGTMLASSRRLEHSIRRNRKILGGGMRQTGILAAAGLHALDHNVGRLQEDHRRAAALAEFLKNLPASAGFKVRLATNMVWFTPRPEDFAPLGEFLTAKGILVGLRRPTMRIVLHLGIGDEDIKLVAGEFGNFYRDET